MLIDLHVHTTVSSCSSLSAEDILTQARFRGLDGVCITDHDSTGVLSQISEGFQSDGLLVLVGMEYGTPQGDFLVFGQIDNLPEGLDAPRLLSEVSKLGGATIAAHPFRGWRPTDTRIFEHANRPLIEVDNGRNTQFENDKASVLAQKLGLTCVAGSDAHTLAELGTFPTRFTVPIASRDELVYALNHGLCRPATSGLMVA